MKSFPSLLFGATTIAASFGAHRVLLRWVERSFRVAIASRRPFVVACAAIAVLPSVSRFFVLRTLSTGAEMVHAVSLLELLFVLVLVVPLSLFRWIAARFERRAPVAKSAKGAKSGGDGTHLLAAASAPSVDVEPPDVVEPARGDREDRRRRDRGRDRLCLRLGGDDRSPRLPRARGRRPDPWPPEGAGRLRHRADLRRPRRALRRRARAARGDGSDPEGAPRLARRDGRPRRLRRAPRPRARARPRRRRAARRGLSPSSETTTTTQGIARCRRPFARRGSASS